VRSLQPPVGLTYTTGAAVLMAELADQTSLPWPDDLPRKIKREKEVDPTKATVVGLSDSN
jgi:hypothetical protein